MFPTKNPATKDQVESDSSPEARVTRWRMLQMFTVFSDKSFYSHPNLMGSSEHVGKKIPEVDLYSNKIEEIPHFQSGPKGISSLLDFVSKDFRELFCLLSWCFWVFGNT